MAGENVQFEEGQDEFCVKNLKRGSNIQKLFFLKRKIILSIFLTFGFWGGPMAGENVQFEESQDKNCVKKILKR